MWWEETDASHVYFYFKRESGVHLLYQAVGAGTQFIGYAQFLTHNKPVYEKEIEISEESRSRLFDYLISRLGMKYSIKHLFGLFLKRLVLYAFNKRIKNYFSDQDKYAVCVEALAKMIAFEKLAPLNADPEDMGMKEAMVLIQNMIGKELINDCSNN